MATRVLACSETTHLRQSNVNREWCGTHAMYVKNDHNQYRGERFTLNL